MALPDAPVRVFRLARIPYDSPRDMFRRMQPFLDALAEELRYDRAELVLAPSYGRVVEMLLSGVPGQGVDAAWLGTAAYAQARVDGLELEPLVAPLREGKGDYRGIIFCRREATMQDLSDLAGRTMAFVDPQSASGYLYPSALLQRHGVRVPHDLLTGVPGHPDFLGDHKNVVLNVYLKKFDAGAVHAEAISDCFKEDPEKRNELRVLGRTPPIQNEPIVVRASLPPARKRLVRQAFLSLGERQGWQFEGLTGFEGVSPRAYRDAVETLSRHHAMLYGDSEGP